MKALLIGGTGPTGPYLAQGLVDRGYDLAIFHRGVHELEELPPAEHIHGDPHFRETIDAALAGRTFDVVVATYGRIRYLAEALAGRCERFISVGGTPSYRGFLQPGKLRPHGMRIPAREDEDLSTEPADETDPAGRFSYLIYSTERRVLDLHAAGAFSASHFRYPRIYGPRQLSPAEWSVVKRVQDGRCYMILPDGGLAIQARAAARNAAHLVLLAVDRPKESAGQAYNVADEDQFTLRQWVELCVDFLGGTLEVFSMPDRLAKPAHVLSALQSETGHALLDLTKVREQLGYRDVVPARQALREAVEWLVEHPLTPESHPNFRDPFNYEAEDRLITAYQRAVEQVEREAPFEVPPTVHSYAHPKQPGVTTDHRGR
ncbi:MAG TPA: epimerase [Dehalococcoidia bacterium]|nr:epimerase [Dehalococcoidia bacterium]